MFPLFHITPFIEVHAFGILLVISWIVFFALLHKYALEHALSKNIFRNIVTYTLSIFFWGRMFYIFSDWRNEKYIFINLFEGNGVIRFVHDFFITENYNITLAGGIFGFFIICIWNLYRERVNYERSIDIIARSFFWAAILGYIGTLLGGQIYGTTFDSFISILYTDKNSIVPMGSARFPLPVVYILTSLGGGLLIEKIRKTYTLPPGFLGYIAFCYFGIFLFLFEFTSGIVDMFESYPPYLNLNQLFGMIFIISGLIGIMRNIKL